MNLKFLLIGLATLCVLGLGLAALDRAMRQRRDRQTIEWAGQAMRAGRYDEAAAEFARAVARHPEDAELSLNSGDAFYALSASKPEALQKAVVAWEAAARIHPNDLPALQRLLHFRADLVEVRPTPAAFRALGEVARRVAAIAPSDPQAKTDQTIARLGPWLSQPGQGGNASDAKAHDELLSALADSLRQENSDPRAILYYALASVRRAVELREGAQDAAARQVLDTAKQRLTGDAGGNSPQALYRAAEGLTALAATYRRLEETPHARTATALVPTSQPAATTQVAAAARSMWPTWDVIDQRVKWGGGEVAQPGLQAVGSPTTRPEDRGTPAGACLEAARALVARAAASVPASDNRFVDIRLLQAQLAEAAGGSRAADPILRQALDARPGSLRAQVALADSVSGSHPDQAEAILDRPEKPDDAGPGPIALARRDLLARAALLKARLYLDAADAATDDDPAARQAAVQKASDACDALAAMLVNDAASLKLTARLRMRQGRPADAVRLLDRALTMPGGRADLDLLGLRGAALVALHDPRPALQSLRAALAAGPSRSGDRLLLAQTLIDEGRLTEADGQVQLAGQQLPSDPRALALRVRFLAARDAGQGNEATDPQLSDAYHKLPEATVKQKLAKAELALWANEAADAVRLLRPERSAGSSAVPVATALAHALIATGKPDEARALLADALRQHPGDATLVAAQKSLDGPASPEASEATLKDLKAKEFLKAVDACRAALQAGDLPRAREQLDAIAQLHGDDPLFLDLKFQYDLAGEQWADAGVCADRLAKANVDGADGRTYAFRLDAAREHFIAAANVAWQMTLRQGRFAQGWVDYGRAMQGVGRPDRAIDSLNKALAIDPNNVGAIKLLAASLLSVGRASEADRWIAQGRQLAPADAELRELEFERQLAQGDPSRLIPVREAAARSEPQRPDNAVALARVYLRVERLEALSNPDGSRKAMAKATGVLTEAVRKWPDDKDCAFWAAHAAAIAGDVPGGKQILRRLCDRVAWTGRPEAQQLLAEFCRTWGDPQSADIALRDATARGAAGATALARQRAELLMRRGSWQSAMDALRPYPSDPLAQVQRITIAVAAGGAAGAEKELEAAQASDPGNPRLMTLRGMLASARRDEAQARRWLDRAFDAGDEQLAARARGELALRDRSADLAGAVCDLAIAREADPSDAGAALLLSEACLRTHDAARAARVLQAALAIAPGDADLRQALVALEREAASPDWGRIESLIEAGRLLAPSDGNWDVTEARMWLVRHEPVRAAALMRHAVRLARTASEVADATVKRQFAARMRALLPDEFWMLLAAQANEAALSEADDVLARYGSGGMLAAWAHYTRAAVNHRVAREAVASDEYTTAIATAQAARGYFGAAQVVETISAEAGADEAIRRINGYVAALDAAGPAQGSGPADPTAHDPRWDLLRIDLYRRNNEPHAATVEVDKLMPRLAAMPAPVQDQMLRMAVVIYLQDEPAPQYDKARAACLELLKKLPEDAWALNNMAAFCLDPSRGADPRMALDYGLRAYRSAERAGGPIDPQIADTYGWALAANGRGDEAVRVLLPVAERLSSPDVQFHLAEAYLAAGSPDSAWPHLASSIRLIQRDQQAGHRVDPGLCRGLVDACWRAAGETAMQGLSILPAGSSHLLSSTSVNPQ
jgi:predicted Zn-dependent protease